MNPVLRTLTVTRYVTPLREGGSLPAIAEADDGKLYVVKFRGAGQGAKALVAELIGGEIARALGLRVPEIIFAELDPAFGRTEPDEEIQDLLKASTGLNLALAYLSGSHAFDPAVHRLDARLASEIVWLDAFLTNVDRTARNTNMLFLNGELHLIDHGASLYFQHSGTEWEEASRRPFTQIKDHVLLPAASELEKTDARFRSLLNADLIRAVTFLLPDAWFSYDSWKLSPDKSRDIYNQFLISRLEHSDVFVNEAIHARKKVI
ncbi:MAG: aminotransferase class I and II [Spirochaetia bacterium]|nr:aminotransferase class I and II [Spirochaetia bacterium]